MEREILRELERRYTNAFKKLGLEKFRQSNTACSHAVDEVRELVTKVCNDWWSRKMNRK